MKEIKAYVRVHMLDKVVHALEEAGFTDMTIDDLRAVRQGLRVRTGASGEVAVDK